MTHIRLTRENSESLCGAKPRQGSQDVFGMRVQTLIYDHLPNPCESDYCKECWDILQSNLPAIEALLHLPGNVE